MSANDSPLLEKYDSASLKTELLRTAMIGALEFQANNEVMLRVVDDR